MMYDTVKERRAYYASGGSVTRDIINEYIPYWTDTSS